MIEHNTTAWNLEKHLVSCALPTHLEAAVPEASAVVVLVPAEEDVGQARLAHPRRAQDHDPRAVVPVD